MPVASCRLRRTAWIFGVALRTTGWYHWDMARPERIEYEGAVYHVTARGNERWAIFHDDADRERFLRVLGESVERFETRLYPFCREWATEPAARELQSNRTLRNRVQEMEDELKCRRDDR